MKSTVYTFYSFKDGSDRTVACANVAASLAKQGKKVLVIDMDFEAPGLHTLFNVENSSVFNNGKGIQNYLTGDLEIEAVRSEIILDLGSLKEEGVKPLSIAKQGKLLYLIASRRSQRVFENKWSYLQERMDQLNYYRL